MLRKQRGQTKDTTAQQKSNERIYLLLGAAAPSAAAAASKISTLLTAPLKPAFLSPAPSKAFHLRSDPLQLAQQPALSLQLLRVRSHGQMRIQARIENLGPDAGLPVAFEPVL